MTRIRPQTLALRLTLAAALEPNCIRNSNPHPKPNSKLYPSMYSCNPNSDPARLGKGLGLGLGLGFRVEGIPSFSMNPYPKPKLR